MKKNCFWKLWRNCVRLLQKKKKIEHKLFYLILFVSEEELFEWVAHLCIANFQKYI